jgi:hypothetical protein
MTQTSIWNALLHELKEALNEQGLDSAHLESASVTPVEEAPLDLAPAIESTSVTMSMWIQMHKSRPSCKGIPFARCTNCNPKLKKKP